MFLAIYGEAERINRLVRESGPNGDGLLYAGEYVDPEEFKKAERARLYGMTAGLAVHRSIIKTSG